jgi:hypothetical protein
MSATVRVLVCGVTIILVAVIVVAIQQYTGFTETNSYLVGGTGGAAGVLVWQLTGPKSAEKAAPLSPKI